MSPNANKKLFFKPSVKYDCVHCEDTRIEEVDLGSERKPGSSPCNWCMQWCPTCKAYKLKKGHQCQPPTK